MTTVGRLHIIHVDLDAFFAAVEQRDRPELRGKPVIVGGDPDGRGVVSTCSYEARKFGVHSAMPAAQARKLCPEGIFLRPRFEAYETASGQIREIFLSHSDLVEPQSLDEAYLDVTVNKSGNPSATRLAEQILREIRRRCDLSASAGVSYNKFLAKVASGTRKPGGLTVVRPDQALDFVAALPVGKFHGIGKVTAARMEKLGIKTGADLRNLALTKLVELFGKAGIYYYEAARGVDERPVCPDYVRKSLGKELTFPTDLVELPEMLEALQGMAADTLAELEAEGFSGKTLTLKVKYADFEQVTRSLTQARPFDRLDVVMEALRGLLAKTEAGKRPVRLLGLSVSGFEPPAEPGALFQPCFPFYEAMSPGWD